MEKEKILYQNEIDANRMMAIILNITILVIGLTWILFEYDVYYARVSVRPLLLSNIIIMAVADAVSRFYKYDKPWIKYMMMAVLVLVYAGTNAVLTYNATLFMVIPIMLSVRYFNRKYTIIIAVLTVIIFFAAHLYGANHGMLDLNFVQYPEGTQITIPDTMWIDDAVDYDGYDKGLMIYNTIIYNYLIKFLQFIIIAVIAVMLVAICQYIIRKQKELSEHSARLSTELSLAEKIQADMLPNIFPAFPDRKEFDLYASMNPAKEVGGDFYDFFMVDDDHLAIVIADVSGKGIPAAMFMMFSKNIVANNAMLGKSPAKALEDANNAICKNNREEMFVTVWLGILEISTGHLIAANAGHEYPALYTPGVGFELYKDKHGLVVGGMEGLKYKDYELQLKPGSKIFVYTDGVPEATNIEEELFGVDRMVEALNVMSESDPKEIISGVRCAVDDYVKEAEQFDDLTMLCLEYKGKEYEDGSN